jgi:sulfur-oxidizing protein SoxX
LIVVLALMLVLGLAACGGGDGAGSAEGDAQAGQTVFAQVSMPPCSSCHSLQTGETIVGPSLAAVAEVAGQRVPGQSAEAYLRKSIVDPDAYVVEGFARGIMPASYGNQLSDEQITDLVAYLMSLD